ncbi:MurR/RpiR family transcriptional regulator [Vagococcus coleopterorum]|uniref:MurR/RpiR family transcriptional regulator n=1 Tax=Vagococcus coleopterorum TaxID=2714946 RepID=A0A6G8APB1_9ENTE|nr:MurR/RpiR family transcriptional regulator [Vagococcus coleopterorum]QIL46827.1 MurR/RpiR family transcriptional regulator [Vagococcus coleopterorum]
MLLTEKLQNPIFSKTECVVIDYLLEQRLLLSQQTIKDISKATFTSPSTLIRISHKMGFDGWKAFKQELLHELDYLDNHFQSIDANFPFKQNDGFTKISGKLGSLVQETINDTLTLLNHDDLSAAVRLLEEAPQIKIFTSNINIYLAQDFCHKMNRINKNVSIISLDGEKVWEASHADSSVLAILISYSGETQSITHLLPIFKKNKVKTLALTNMGDNTISKFSDCTLKISTREKLYSKIAGFSSHYSICFLLDTLYSALFSLNYEENFKQNLTVSQLNDPRFSHLDALKED